MEEVEQGVEPQDELIEAPAEAVAEPQLIEPKPEPTSHGSGIWLALGIAFVGLLCIAGGVWWKYGSSNEVVEMLGRMGATPTYAYAAGAIFFALAAHASAVGRRNARIAELEYQLSIVEERSAGSDSFSLRVGPAIESLATSFGDVRGQMEEMGAHLSGMESKVRTSEKQNITLAASVDGLTAKVDKVLRDVSYPKNAPAIGDELQPLVRLLDSHGREQHSRAARLLEGFEAVQDTLAAMEGRMRERLDGVQTNRQAADESTNRIISAVGELRSHLEAAMSEVPRQLAEVSRQVSDQMGPMPAQVSAQFGKVGENLSKKVDEAVEKMGKRVEEMGKSLRAQIVGIVASSPSSAMPSAPLPTMDDSSSFAEGPRESKTTLQAIDKLRNFRGNP